MRPSRRQTAVLLLVGLLVVPGTAAGVVRGSPDIDVSASDTTFTPGSNPQLQVTLTNEGELDTGSATNPSLDAEVTTARGVDITLDASGTPVEVETGTQSLGRLAQGGEASLGYGLTIPDDAEPGTYTLEATVEYEHTSSISESTGARNQETDVRHFDVEIEIDDRARFEVVNTESDVRVGSMGTVEVTMENVGSETASETSVALAAQNADVTFGESASTSRFVGDWAPGETRTVAYQVAAADSSDQQQYAFSATATFEDADGVTHESDQLSLGVEPMARQQFRVVDTESTVAVGDTGTVSVTLENAGSVSVNDATVALESQSANLGFGESASATRYIGEWESGETRTVEYDVSATDGADTRSYALEATIAYEDQNDDPGTSRALSLGVTTAAEQSFSLSDVSTDLRVGEEGTINGTITNDGDTAARNVVVEFTTENQQLSHVETAHSVGTLEPGEAAEFSFTTAVTSAADAGPRQFSFVANYRTSDGTQRASDELLTRQRIAGSSDAFAVEPVNATYAPGEAGELTVRVTNTANETLSDISAKLFADDPVSVDDEEAFVDELAPGESTTLSFEVTTAGSAMAKSYPVSLDFQYEDSDGDTHVSDSHEVPVTVAEPDSDGEGGGLPLALVGLGAVGVVGVGAVLRYRR